MDGKPNLWLPVSLICDRLGLDPNSVREMTLTPTTLRVESYLVNEDGLKYVRPNTQEPATATRLYEITTLLRGRRARRES